MITVHCVFHAHLDPIWLWPWTAGLDEALATCRSACDRLDTHPDLWFTQGEAWTFAMVERADPALFARIRRHIDAGRWEVVNGWWCQGDCNAPGIDGLRAQIRTGLAYVHDRFGLRPRCGFNPDSFGHAAILPDLLAEHGQDRYVFMRPGPGEMTLPASAFRWRGRSATVTATRLSDTYLGGLNGDLGAIHAALRAAAPGARNVLVCCGLGNHGGGPTERIITALRDASDRVPGARLVFSTVNAYFDALAAEGRDLPTVDGELQQHAIGCYALHRPLKNGLRRAEHALARAAQADPAADLEGAWRAVSAHAFHDTLGGTCLEEAYPFVLGQVGGAEAMAEETLAYAVRRQVAALPDHALPRLVLANPGSEDFSGWCEARCTVEGPWRNGFRLLDEDGAEVPHQLLHPGAAMGDGLFGLRRILVHRDLAAGSCRWLALDRGTPTPLPQRLEASPAHLANDRGVRVEVTGGGPRLRHGDLDLSVALQVIPDPSDTWSHRLDRYAETPEAAAIWSPATVVESGPLRAALRQEGRLPQADLIAEWRLAAGEATVDLDLQVAWRGRHQVLKLVLPLQGQADRVDGTPGRGLQRPNDGRELPLQDAVACGSWGLVVPDVHALDATPDRLRLTLLRSPLYAHHDPTAPEQPRPAWLDQGTHRYRLRVHLAPCGIDDLRREAVAWHRPPLVAETTRGMPCRMFEGTP